MKCRSSEPTESEEQIGLLNWWRDSGFPRIFHIPNGGHRSISTAKALREQGVSPGVPDYYCPEWRMWIEMKRQTQGRVSKEQADWHDYLESIGDTVIIGRGAQDASRKILAWLQNRCCNGDAMRYGGGREKEND